MDKYTVLGYRDVCFTDKETGKEVSGISLYLSRPADGVNGVMAEKIFLGRKCLEESNYAPYVGDSVGITFNRYGKAACVTAF